MRFREVVSYGLIAGLSYSEMRNLAPGLILDLFVLRRNYDDTQHSITREVAAQGDEW